jgi:hypothetical protein
MLSNLQNINPYEIFEKLGLSQKETDQVLTGDYEPVTKEKPFIIDFSVFYSNYGKYFNFYLIKHLFNTAREQKELSTEEKEIYNEAINDFFELIFKVGIDGYFLLNGEFNEDCLLVQFENEYYILIKTPDFNKIYFLEKTSTS